MASSRLTARVALTTTFVVAGVCLAGPALAGTDYPPGGGTSVLGTTLSRPAPTKVLSVSGVKASTVTKNVSVPTSKALAFTGSDAIVGGLVLGSALVAVGSGAMVAGRRRKVS